MNNITIFNKIFFTCLLYTSPSPRDSGFTAPNAAGVIHSDFERGFIKAEVIDFDDYIKNGGELGSKENGKLRLEGKEYLIKDGDVIHFKFNV